MWVFRAPVAQGDLEKRWVRLPLPCPLPAIASQLPMRWSASIAAPESDMDSEAPPGQKVAQHRADSPFPAAWSLTPTSSWTTAQCPGTDPRGRLRNCPLPSSPRGPRQGTQQPCCRTGAHPRPYPCLAGDHLGTQGVGLGPAGAEARWEHLPGHQGAP
ncbi:hypothetical protein MC885_011178 [Smutsia gigantea]|nr:hypothetical protein MC885_011178 [Smutsia gigantea]